MTEIQLVHEAIQALPKTDLSDCQISSTLPFPSLLRPPVERFSVSKDTLCTFQYMGRSIFQQILLAVQEPGFRDAGWYELYLYGPSGTGKSHILAALVVYLIKSGQRVVYFPDCRDILKDRVTSIRLALLFAFHDNKDSCEEIIRATDTNALLDFVRNQKRYSFYVIVDQYNALDVNPEPDDRATVKGATRTDLEALCQSQRYMFSASTNEKSARLREQRQTSIRTINLLGGLTRVCPSLFNFLSHGPQDETDAWFKHHEGSPTLSQLTPLDREFIEDITGRIPLLLQPLLQMDKFDQMSFLNCKAMTNVTTNITAFYNELFRKSADDQTRNK